MKENLKINLKIFICNLIGTFQLIKTSLGLPSYKPWTLIYQPKVILMLRHNLTVLLYFP